MSTPHHPLAGSAACAWNEASARRRERRERRADLKATCALTAYALALLALVAGLAWLIERLPPGVGGVVAAVATWAILVAVLGGRR
jgi:hypothetical protein